MTEYNIPDYTKEAIDRYVKDGIPVGGFLTAFLSNDLMGALGRADINNRFALFAIADYVYNEIPANCWGSVEIMQSWMEMKAAE